MTLPDDAHKRTDILSATVVSGLLELDVSFTASLNDSEASRVHSIWLPLPRQVDKPECILVSYFIAHLRLLSAGFDLLHCAV